LIVLDHSGPILISKIHTCIDLFSIWPGPAWSMLSGKQVLLMCMGN